MLNDYTYKTLMLSQKILENVALIALDEISMATPAMIATLDSRLRQIKKTEDPFGGLALMCLGDFCQLECIGGTPLFVGALKPPRNRIEAKGAELFCSLRLFNLNIQKRSVDERHTAILEQMRNLDRPTSVDDQTLRYLRSRILREGAGNTDLWRFATVGVLNNISRHTINKRQVMEFAKRTGQPVIAWRARLTTSRRQLNATNAGHDWLYENNPQLTQYFCYGAVAYMDSNLNPSKGLANGTRVQMTGIVFEKPQGTEEVIDAFNAKKEAAQPGEIVMAPLLPSSLLLRPYVTDDEKRTWPADQTTTSNSVTIPLLRVTEKIKVTAPSGQKELTVERFALTLGYAVTIWKLQGATLDKIIIDVSEPKYVPKWNYYLLLVAASRVRRGEDLGIVAPNITGFAHLKGLQPREELRKWWGAYDNDGVFHRPENTAAA